MASITSTGIGSGLDINSIVTQLADIERLPLKALETKAASLQTKLSVYGQIQSRLASLQDAADALGKASTWASSTALSTDASAVSVTSTEGAAPMQADIEVQQLARGQASASAVVATDTKVSDGALNIQQGSWATGAFVPNGVAISIDIADGTNTLKAIAASINNSTTAGLQAVVLRDASGERLLLRSSTTGATSGFNLQLKDAQGANSTELSFIAPAPDRRAADAKFTIDGVSMTSASNTVPKALPGMSLKLAKVTSAPVNVSIAQDNAAIKKKMQAMVDAYNAVQELLASSTKYNPGTATAGNLQSDQTAVGLMHGMRRAINTSYSGLPLQRAQDVGISIAAGGTLKLDSTKLTTALDKLEDIKALFSTGANGVDGLGKVLGAFAKNALASSGQVGLRTTALQDALKRNGTEQERVTARADRAEARLFRTYNAMDTKMGQLNAMNAYVTQQMTALTNNTINNNKN